MPGAGWFAGADEARRRVALHPPRTSACGSNHRANIPWSRRRQASGEAPHLAVVYSTRLPAFDLVTLHILY